MTEKLFYEDQYIKEFDANVVNIIERNNKILVELDKTCFFPGGGGQFCDVGFIGESKVLDMLEEDGKIYHIVDKKPIKLEDIKCYIDWERRLDGMQQHLGQHLLSGCFYSLFGANTAGIHIGDEISTVDIVGYITEEQTRKAEVMANDIIRENREVKFLMTSRKEAKSMGLRRELATKDQNIRIVEIDDLDINACCGIHPSSTLELQAIKLKRYEKHKGNTRIVYLTGKRAIDDHLKVDSILSGICKDFSAGEDEVFSSLNNLKENYNSLRGENSKIKAELSQFEMKELLSESENINNVLVVNKIYENEDAKYLNKLASKIVEDENRIVLFATHDKEKANMIFAASKNMTKINISNILKDSISLIDGRGGGSSILAQGAGKNISNLENAMVYSLRRVKELL